MSTAEAMTVFAVMTAGLFPLIHVGRPWFAYWLMPYPNERALWPNFKSPIRLSTIMGLTRSLGRTSRRWIHYLAPGFDGGSETLTVDIFSCLGMAA